MKNLTIAVALFILPTIATNPAHAQQTVVVTPTTVVVPAATAAVSVTTTTVTTVAPGTVAVPVAPATATPVYGSYLDVPAQSLAADGTIAPQTVRFMVDTSTPATTSTMPTVQLMLTPAAASSGLFINRNDLPVQLQIGPFAEMEMLFVPLGPENFRSDFALDLLRADGTFNGHSIQLTGPLGQPLAGFGVIYESTLGSASSPTTGTVVPYAGGNILIPNSNLNATTDFPDFSLLITDPANSQAYRVDSLGVHVIQKQARDADGITQVVAPFLNDATTTAPRLELFTGQITNTAGQPVAHKPFRLDPPYEALLHISQFADTPSFYTGTDGRFSLVFDTMGYYGERGTARSWSPVSLTVLTPNGPQEFPVRTGQDNVLQMQ